LQSKIINMAERMKDAEDRWLESMFGSQAIADDGFSAAVVRKVKRRLWVRRLALPVAAAIGGVIAFQPLVALVTSMARLVALIPTDTVSTAAGSVPTPQMVVLGAIFMAAGLLGVRLLED